MSDLLWGRHPAPSRGPKPALTLGRIADAGIALADAEGLDAVSMQRIAAEVGVTKMALYRYVPGKAELVGLMSDLAVGAPPEQPARPWREALQRWALDLYAAFERHPWLLVSTVGRRHIGPNELTWMDRGVQSLADTGLDGSEQFDAILLVTGHVRAIAQQTLTIPGGTTGVTEEDITAALATAVTSEPDRFPAIAAALPTMKGGENQGLSFGLERILDGLASVLDRRRG